jgi:hypothetical protein
MVPTAGVGDGERAENADAATMNKVKIKAQPEGVARDPASRPDRGEASVPQNAPTRRPAVDLVVFPQKARLGVGRSLH